MMTSVNRIFLRRSGILKALTKALSTAAPILSRSTDQLDAAPGALDLLRRRPRERVRAHGERPIELPAAEHLHGAALAHEAVREQRVGIDVAPLEDARERLDVHDGVLDAVEVGEALQLRDAPLQRHLAAL